MTTTRKTQEMLKNLSRYDVEELTELFGHGLGRLLKSCEQLIKEVENGKSHYKLNKFPTYTALKEDVRILNQILDQEMSE
jgi:hypothetical protein